MADSPSSSAPTPPAPLTLVAAVVWAASVTVRIPELTFDESCWHARYTIDAGEPVRESHDHARGCRCAFRCFVLGGDEQQEAEGPEIEDRRQPKPVQSSEETTAPLSVAMRNAR